MCRMAMTRGAASSARPFSVPLYRGGKGAAPRSAFCAHAASPDAIAASPPVIVGGAGKVGRALASMCPGGAVIVGRGGRVPEGGEEPVWVATHNADLEAVLEQTPLSRWPDLCFFQNGMLRPWLQQHGLEDNTQCLVYMAASTGEDGEPKVVDGKLTAVRGRHADHLASVLNGGGVACRVLRSQEFEEQMVEKLLWASIFWCMSAAHGGMPVGRIVDGPLRIVVGDLVGELLPLATSFLGLQSADAGAVTDRLCEYSSSIPRAVPSADMARAEFEWRNGWFLSQGITPLHTEYLRMAGVDVVLPGGGGGEGRGNQ